MSIFSYSSTLQLRPTWTEELDVTSVVDKTSAKFEHSFTDGTAANQANAYWRDVLTVSPSATVSLDLSALSTTFMGGTGTLAFASVKAFAAINRSTTATLAVGDTISDRWTALSASPITVGPDAVLYVVHPNAGYTVGASDKVLAITNNGGSAADVELYVVGVLA